MRNRLVLRLLFFTFIFLSSELLFSQNAGLTIFPFGWDINFSEEKINNDFNIGLFDFFLENNTGLGVEIEPIRYQFVNERHMFSLIKIFGYWNFFAFFDDLSIPFFDLSRFGPFISIDYPIIYTDKKFGFTDYVLDIGLKYSYLYSTPMISVPLIGFECGYRRIAEKNYFYLGIQTSIYSILLIPDVLRMDSDYYKKGPRY